MNKDYTSIEQSQKLIKLGIDKTTSDMYYDKHPLENYYSPIPIIGKYSEMHNQVPAWSLAALIEQMPSDIKGHELTIRKSYWQIEKTSAYELSYEEDFEYYPPSILISTSSIELIDACVKMIIKLNELKML